METLLISVIAVLVGLAGGFLLRKLVAGTRIQADEKFAEKVLNDAKREAETIKKESMLQAKDYLYQARSDFEKESKEKRLELQGIEKDLSVKRKTLIRSMTFLRKGRMRLSKRKGSCLCRVAGTGERKKYTDMIAEERKKLESISGISSEEAKRLLIADMESEARQEAAKIIKKIEDETRRSLTARRKR